MGERVQGRSVWFGAMMSLALFVGAALYMAVGIRRPLNVYDEGLILHGAERILLGELPYRDFWTVYAPGQYYVLAALFEIFGARVLVARVYDTLLRAALAVASYHLAGRLAPRPWPLFVWAFLVAWLGFFEFYLYPIYPALLLSVLAMLAMHRAVSSERPGGSSWWWIVGCLVGSVALLRHDFGGYQLVVMLAAGGVWAWRATDPLNRGAREVSRPLFRVTGGAALVAGPPYLVLAYLGGADVMWDQLVRFPATVFADVRRLPFPVPTAPIQSVVYWEQCLAYLPYYVPISVALLGLLLSLYQATRRHPMVSSWVITASLSLLGVFLFQQAWVRSDLVHNVQMLVLAPILMAGLAAGPADGSRTWRRCRAIVALALLVALLAHPWRERVQLWQAGFPWPDAVASRIVKAHPLPLEPQLERVSLRLRSLAAPDERVYVGLGTHDRVFVNEPLIYYLADRIAATRYHELHPGQVTTREVQQEIIQELEREAVRWIVISTRFDGVREPNASSISSGVTDLDQYIITNYDIFDEIGPYIIWSRKQMAAAS